MGKADLRSHTLLSINSSTRDGLPFHKLLVREVPEFLPKQYRQLPLLLVAHWNYMIRLYCQRLHTACSQDIQG